MTTGEDIVEYTDRAEFHVPPELLDPSWEWVCISETSGMGLGREPKFPTWVYGFHASGSELVKGRVVPCVDASIGAMTAESPGSNM